MKDVCTQLIKSEVILKRGRELTSHTVKLQRETAKRSFSKSKQILGFLKSRRTYCTAPEKQNVQVIKEPQALHYWKWCKLLPLLCRNDAKTMSGAAALDAGAGRALRAAGARQWRALGAAVLLRARSSTWQPVSGQPVSGQPEGSAALQVAMVFWMLSCLKNKINPPQENCQKAGALLVQPGEPEHSVGAGRAHPCGAFPVGKEETHPSSSPAAETARRENSEGEHYSITRHVKNFEKSSLHTQGTFKLWKLV